MYRQARRQIMLQLEHHVHCYNEWEEMYYLHQCKNDLDRQMMKDDQILVEHLGGRLLSYSHNYN